MVGFDSAPKKRANLFSKGKKDEVVDRTEGGKMLRFGPMMGPKVGARSKPHS